MSVIWDKAVVSVPPGKGQGEQRWLPFHTRMVLPHRAGHPACSPSGCESQIKLEQERWLSHTWGEHPEAVTVPPVLSLSGTS